MLLMPGMRVSASGDHLECLPGWRVLFEQGVLKSCYLCPSGQYALGVDLVDAVTQMVLCASCPKGTYSGPGGLAVGGCTLCPPLQTTLHQGASSLAECFCPPPLVTNAMGQCEGCTDRQYVTEGSGCQPCPMHARTSGGHATSLQDCLCDKGYQLALDGTCEECPEGTYSTTASRAPCSLCSDVGATSTAVGATSVLSCDTCLVGFTRRFQLWCASTKV